MPSFPIMPTITPRTVSLPEFDYVALFVVIYILIVLIIISYEKSKQKKSRLWSRTTIILAFSLVTFIFTNIWLQTQPPVGFTPSQETTKEDSYEPTAIKTNLPTYYGKPPLNTVTDNAKKSSIGGVILYSAGQPVANKELVLHGTTTDGSMNLATLIANTFTDKNGTYVFTALQPGKYSVQIVEKKDAGSYETSVPFYKNQHEVILGVNEHITDYNYDYSNPY